MFNFDPKDTQTQEGQEQAGAGEAANTETQNETAQEAAEGQENA